MILFRVQYRITHRDENPIYILESFAEISSGLLEQEEDETEEENLG